MLYNIPVISILYLYICILIFKCPAVSFSFIICYIQKCYYICTIFLCHILFYFLFFICFRFSFPLIFIFFQALIIITIPNISNLHVFSFLPFFQYFFLHTSHSSLLFYFPSFIFLHFSLPRFILISHSYSPLAVKSHSAQGKKTRLS